MKFFPHFRPGSLSEVVVTILDDVSDLQFTWFTTILVLSLSCQKCLDVENVVCSNILFNFTFICHNLVWSKTATCSTVCRIICLNRLGLGTRDIFIDHQTHTNKYRFGSLRFNIYIKRFDSREEPSFINMFLIITVDCFIFACMPIHFHGFGISGISLKS